MQDEKISSSVSHLGPRSRFGTEDGGRKNVVFILRHGLEPIAETENVSTMKKSNDGLLRPMLEYTNPGHLRLPPDGGFSPARCLRGIQGKTIPPPPWPQPRGAGDQGGEGFNRPTGRKQGNRTGGFSPCCRRSLRNVSSRGEACFAPTPSSHPPDPSLLPLPGEGRGRKGAVCGDGRRPPPHTAFPYPPLPRPQATGGEGDQGGEGSEKANRAKAEHPDGRVQPPPRKVTA
jgi:hypothetical protein